MLVLTRRVGETICIGDKVTVVVIQASDGRCRLGVTAPSDVAIDRLEVRMIKEGKEVDNADRNSPNH